MKKWLIRFGVPFIVLVLAFRLADWAARRGGSLPVPPQPNGYAELLSAAHALKKPPIDLVGLSGEQVQGLADENRAALEKARKGLQMPSAVSVETKKGWLQQHDDELKELKGLAVVLTIEAKSQILRSHTNDAARCHLDTIRLAQAVSRGGILVDGITGLTIETIGSASLEAMIPRLDASFCREAARMIEKLDTQREPPENVVQMEKAWSRQNFGLVARFGEIFARESTTKRYAQFITKSHACRTRTQRVMLRLAARVYELENGRSPTKTSELIPAYLERVPRDAETGLELQEIPAAVK